MAHRTFQRNNFGGSGCYDCGACGKKTRDTGRGEAGVQLCLACYVQACRENRHSDDDHDGPLDTCPICAEINANTL